MSDKNTFAVLAMLEAIQKIEEFTKDISNADEFYSNQLVFDACLMNFIVIGEMTLRIDEPLKNSTQDIEWYKIKGFRNIVAHDYLGIDVEEVWQIIKSEMPKLRTQLEEIVSS
jgi:uncharacterized protein with HEPN domain